MAYSPHEEEEERVHMASQVQRWHQPVREFFLNLVSLCFES